MKISKLFYLHLFFWVIYVTGAVLVPYFVFHSKNTIFNITFFITSITCFYVNYFIVVPKFFDADKLYKSFFAFFLGVAAFVMVRYFAEEMFLPQFFGIRNYAKGISFGFYFFDNIFYSSTTIFISTTFWFFKYSMKAEQEKSELIEARKTAELQALKTQINPHFIFNSLNNIYSLVYQKSDKALPALEELSQLLRYSTKDLGEDAITLDKEIGYIDSLTALEKLRIKDPELLVFEKNISHPKLNISPMILVPFVENAFKHGDFRDKGFLMKISDNNQILHFYLLNYKKERMKDSVSGIGIENVKKRLEILYPKKYELNIKDSQTEFVVDLKIDLRNE
ncbi:sensor histidine kinase [Chryseobacterium geocarposphaerae]|uniref:Histidine kinase n=1 Tax=Chryseobacterium geocarposphaerae TaxID=1416776 RepID=A0A2M9C2Z7_9FLAO|nr:histidine kinase [Chryseobacterium geocarposphaerae]PJJ64793.1 histidine kinase [Chryseobacterium geocarposphaerae]